MQDVRREQVILLTEWPTRPFVNERRYLCAEVQEEKVGLQVEVEGSTASARTVT